VRDLSTPFACWRHIGPHIHPDTQLSAFLHSWKEIIEFLLEVNAGRNAVTLTPGSSVGRSQAHKIKDRFKVCKGVHIFKCGISEHANAHSRPRDLRWAEQGFNDKFAELTQTQKAYAIPDPELRTSMRKSVIDLIVPLYAKFVERYADVNFSKNPSKYIQYRPEELDVHLQHLFDTSS